jgi:hypothetical protein
VCAAVVVLVVHRALVHQRELPRRWIVVALVMGALATNVKLLLAPVVFASLVVLALESRRSRLVCVLASPIVFASQLVNLVSPRFLPWPQPFRFAASLLEAGAHPFGHPHRYTVDQWMPPHMDGARMGGFLHVYVIALLALLVLLSRSREGRMGVLVMIGLTAIVAVMPQSHVLRYYMVWMLVLVALVVMLGARALKRHPIRAVLACAIVPVSALATTAYATGGMYFTPDPYSVHDVLRERVESSVVAAIPENGRACIAKPPLSVLYAARFHPPRRYSIVIRDRCD